MDLDIFAELRSRKVPKVYNTNGKMQVAPQNFKIFMGPEVQVLSVNPHARTCTTRFHPYTGLVALRTLIYGDLCVLVSVYLCVSVTVCSCLVEFSVKKQCTKVADGSLESLSALVGPST